MKTETKIKTAALIGGGVIGAGWAARLLINGIDVTLCDPSERAAARVEPVIAAALRAYRRMTLAPVAQRGKLTFTDSVTDAVTAADFVQESAPERIDIKRELIRTVCAHAPAEVVVASSSSGLLPSALQHGVRFPERVLIGHPFNPVYLMPLVEIVGGRQTGDEAKQVAAGFYRSIGMHPLFIRKEIDAFVADRMMEALWREALHLVNDGVATTDDIDQALAYGPGLRWAFMGPFMTYRVAGGEGGFRHFMAQFGPSLQWPWARFDGPELTDALLDKLTAQSDAQAAGLSIAELEQRRDDCLVAVLRALRTEQYAAGQTLQRYEEQLYEAGHRKAMADADDLRRPLRLHAGVVPPEWVDYNAHMTESRYLQAFGDASDALFRYIGVDRAYHAAGCSYYTVETHINFLREAHVDARFAVTTQLLGGDEKRIHLFHRMHAVDGDAVDGDGDGDGELLATTEQLLLHVDTAAGKVCAARPEVFARLSRILDAHAGLPAPPQAGRAIQRRSPRA